MSAQAITLDISIARDPDAVYAFASNVENFPQWASGLGESVRRAGEDWIVETGAGPLKLRMTPPNPFRVLDHTVYLPSGAEVHVPFRVLAASGGGSEVILTLFRQPDMSEEDFARDREMVRRDLLALKQIMERTG